MDEGIAAALKRIDREMDHRSGILDLGGLRLQALPDAIFQLEHLRVLSIGDRWFDGRNWHYSRALIGKNDLERELPRLQSLPQLRELHLAGIPLSALEFLRTLQELELLDISRTPLARLDGLNSLSALREIRFDETAIADLSPLRGLQQLKLISCNNTQVEDVSPVAAIRTLQTLSAEMTPLSNLQPLSQHPALRTIKLGATKISNIVPLGTIPTLESLTFPETQVSDISPLAGNQTIETIDLSKTPITDYSPLATLTNCRSLRIMGCSDEALVQVGEVTFLEELFCGFGPLSDLSPIADLTSLQFFSASYSSVSDTSPLGTLSALNHLRLVNTDVADLSPLCSLENLRNLAFSRSKVRDLGPIRGLRNIVKIECSGCEVMDLSPLETFGALVELNCEDTKIDSLAPLSRSLELSRLIVSGTNVRDLAPLASLEKLQYLNAARTEVADVTPLANLPQLNSVDVSQTRVSNIDALLAKSSVSISARYCRLASLPSTPTVYERSSQLVLTGSHVQGMPSELFAQSAFGEDHCGELVAHFRDLQAGHVSLSRSKIMILGNGRLGKTQLRRRMFEEAYDEAIPSTHGVQVNTRDLLTGQPKRPVLVTAWDFGGQDIYHGTHALFMQTRAIFFVCWSPEFEESVDIDPTGLEFRNRPLPYWLDYIRDVSGTQVPVVVVQTRSDTPTANRPLSAAARERLERFAFWRNLSYSSKNDRGRGALDSALVDAIDWMRDEVGDVLIGSGRLDVLRKLEGFRTEDASVREEDRRWRLLSRSEFDGMCAEAGNVSSSDHLLGFLHNAGVLFYRKGMFADQIVLDQAWALNAIYSVFNRDQCVRQLRALNARFSRSLLEALVWRDYSKDEQELFISMMMSCGIIFTYRRPSGHAEETEYVAPDLLPQRTSVEAQIESVWNVEGEPSVHRYEYDFLHDGFVRALISTVGEIAGPNAVYWRGGMCAFDLATQSRVLLEEKRGAGWSGAIVVSARNGHKDALLERVGELIGQLEHRIGLKRTMPPNTVTVEGRSNGESGGDDGSSVALKFVPEPRRTPAYAVSYAWNDATEEGQRREELVDKFCVEAAEKGIAILRDKTHLGLGDDLSHFMDRISQSARIAVFLSDRYLKSSNCMYELYQTWNFHRRNPEMFLRTVRVFSLPCATIWTTAGRVGYARYWSDEVQSTLQAARGDVHLLGEMDFVAFKRMQQFSMCVGDILSLIASRVQPRTFADFLKSGLDGQP